ncbi:MAG: hypothetical protein HQ522_23260 [Bacteroidetes bacterium]|nr:hypothetical protein [Bacteroidota bacterium]
MKQIIFILACSFLIFAQLFVSAQEKSHEDRREKYRSEKISFLTSNLELTPTEAEKFWPVYNKMEKERWEAQTARRELETKVRESEESLSEKKIIQLTKDYAGSTQKEGALLTKYNEEFLNILPPKKVLKLYKTETDFRIYMMKRYREQRKNDEKHP